MREPPDTKHGSAAIGLAGLLLSFTAPIIWLAAPWVDEVRHRPDHAAWVQLYLVPTTLILFFLGYGTFFHPYKTGLVFLIVVFVVDGAIALGCFG